MCLPTAGEMYNFLYIITFPFLEYPTNKYYSTLTLIIMKKLLVIALIISAKSAFAQKDIVGLNVPFVNNTIVYERVFDAPNTSQNLLYSNAGLWMAETHPYVVNTQPTLQDPVISRVVGRANSYIGESYKVLWQTQYYSYNFSFTIQIDCKDNKYRVRIYNIEDVIDASNKTPMDDMMQALINSKSLTLSTGGVMKKDNFVKIFQGLNSVVASVVADINKNMLADNSF